MPEDRPTPDSVEDLYREQRAGLLGKLVAARFEEAAGLTRTRPPD